MGGAPGLGALLPGEGRVGFCGVGANLLSIDHSGEREGEESEFGEHFVAYAGWNLVSGVVTFSPFISSFYKASHGECSGEQHFE